MRRLLFASTLLVHGFAATELHEWVRVPQVLLHLLEHHSSFGHYHDDPRDHGHESDEGHNPFGQDRNETCDTGSLVSLPVVQQGHSLITPTGISLRLPSDMETSLAAYSGSKWNPPKRG